jgi:hypothetical protein
LPEPMVEPPQSARVGLVGDVHAARAMTVARMTRRAMRCDMKNLQLG